MGVLLVFLGGGLGAVLRHAANRLAFAQLGAGFPWATLGVNVVGSFVMGLLVGVFATTGTPQPARLFLATGLLGGFTTFSAFSLDALALYQRGQPAAAAGFVAATVLLSLAAIAAGVAITRA